MHKCQRATTHTSSTTTLILTTVERVCCQEPPSYLTKTRVVDHALQYAICIAVTGWVRYATGVSYIGAVQLSRFSRFQSQPLWGLYSCPSSRGGTLSCSFSRLCSSRETQLLHFSHEFRGKSMWCLFPHAQDVDEDIPAIKSALIMHAKQTKCPNLVQKKKNAGTGTAALFCC